MRLHIPNPCPEDWNNMNPVKGGAFCNKCEKKVFDFSKQSKTEIINFFENKKPGEKICGKFSKKQFFSLNFDDFFTRFRLWNLAKRIALIFCFTFGIGLSSCNLFPPSGEVIEQKHLTGDSIDITKLPVDTISDNSADTLINKK